MRILLQVADLLEALLVAQLDPAQIKHGVLHRDRDLLAKPRLLPAKERGEDADQQVHAAVAVAEGGAADRWRTVPEAGGRSGASGALRHVLVDLEIRPRRVLVEPLHRAEDQPRIELVDVFPGQAHAVHGSRREVLHQHIGVPDQLLHDLLALRGLGVDREGTLVAVQHREVQRIDIRDVTQLLTGHVSAGDALDLEDVGPEPREHLGARGAGLDAGEVDDLDSVQWQVGHDGFPSRRKSLVFISSRRRSG